MENQATATLTRAPRHEIHSFGPTRSNGDADYKSTRPDLSRLGVLISGRGSNLQSIIEAITKGELQARIAVVISNRADAAGLARAREAGIEAVHLDPGQHPDRSSYDRAIVAALKQREVDLVCLAGFMRLSEHRCSRHFPNVC